MGGGLVPVPGVGRWSPWDVFRGGAQRPPGGGTGGWGGEGGGPGACPWGGAAGQKGRRFQKGTGKEGGRVGQTPPAMPPRPCSHPHPGQAPGPHPASTPPPVPTPREPRSGSLYTYRRPSHNSRSAERGSSTTSEETSKRIVARWESSYCGQP